MRSDARGFTYADALAALEAAARFGIHPTLETTRVLCAHLGDPQQRFASVQVTGTNGKSSTTRLVSALLRAHGLREGAYTSPELVTMTERIEVGGAPISEGAFARAVESALGAETAAREARRLATDDVVTEFELLTVAAFWAFAEAGVDVACLEVGMGGRWDATSVVSPAVAVITGVSLDHTERLGRTREAIAEDKAHVIKPGAAAVLGPGTEGVDAIFLARAEACGTHARAVRAAGAPSPVPEEYTVRFDVTARPDRPGGSLVLDVFGAHRAYRGLTLRAPSYQAANVATAIAAAEAAVGGPLEPDAVREALARMHLPGRFELVRETPPVVVDGAHNPEAASVLAAAIDEAWPTPPGREGRPWLLLGVLSDKDARGIVSALVPVVSGISVTASRSPRAVPAAELAAVVRDVTGTMPDAYASVGEALDSLVPSATCGLVVAGSITTAGEARAHLRD